MLTNKPIGPPIRRARSFSILGCNICDEAADPARTKRGHPYCGLHRLRSLAEIG